MFAFRLRHLTAIFVLVLVSSYAANAQTETVLYKFTGTRDENNSSATLVANGGKLYGTIPFGGTGYGIVYELSPNGSGGWNETTIHTFNPAGGDGYSPAYLTTDGKGNLFGTTYLGGANERGVLYELSPAGDQWVETILFSFGVGSAGVVPFGNLIIDSAGNIFGTDNIITTEWTEAVYEASPSNGYVPNPIYNLSFVTATGGNGGLAMDASGNIFGISVQGFLPQIAIAFELSPNGSGGWNSKTLYTFPNRIEPESPPTLDKLGRIYGTTIIGGDNNNGTVYRLAPDSKGQWKLHILYSFKGGKADGSGPYAGVVFDASGNMYGTTSGGGEHNSGTIFELSPVGNGSYQEKILWSFNFADGYQPLSGVLRDSAGNLFGVTQTGGDKGCGAFQGCGLAFELTP
jgi:uncharacterized repeat protein (TIGR03803 family)